MNKQMQKRQERSDVLNRRLDELQQPAIDGDEDAQQEFDIVFDEVAEIAHSFVGRYRHLLRNRRGRGVKRLAVQ